MKAIFSLMFLILDATNGSAAPNPLPISVAYKHRNLTVNYILDCADEKTSGLASEPGQTPVWRIEVTPHRQSHELIWVDGKVFEDQKVVFNAGMQLKVGGGPATLIPDPDSADPHSLSFELKPVNQASNGASN